MSQVPHCLFVHSLKQRDRNRNKQKKLDICFFHKCFHSKITKECFQGVMYLSTLLICLFLHLFIHLILFIHLFILCQISVCPGSSGAHNEWENEKKNTLYNITVLLYMNEMFVYFSPNPSWTLLVWLLMQTLSQKRITKPQWLVRSLYGQKYWDTPFFRREKGTSKLWQQRNEFTSKLYFYLCCNSFEVNECTSHWGLVMSFGSWSAFKVTPEVFSWD